MDEQTQMFVSRLLSLLFAARKFHCAPPGKLKERDILLIKHIWDQNPDHQISISALARYMNMTPSAVSQLVSSLEKKNLVQRICDPADRRSVYVQITESGRNRQQDRFQEISGNVRLYLDYLG